MMICAQRLQVAEALFEEIRGAGIVSEGSYAALLRAQVASGERAAALATLRALLDDDGATVRLRTCAPLLADLCAADERQEAMGMWERLKARGVAFSPREYCLMLGMHGRHGGVAELWALLGELLTDVPNPDAGTVEQIRSAVEGCAAAAGGDAQVTFEWTRVTPSGR
eukprot:2845116-Prymnesium_polylepis.1